MAKTIALPGKNSPTRYPSYPALERTALMAFNATTSLVTLTGTTRVLLMRQAAYPFWAEQPTAGVYAYAAAWQCQTKPVQADPTDTSVLEPIPGMINTINNGETSPANSTRVGISYGGVTKLNYPGNYPIMGVDSNVAGTEFIYVPAGASLVAVVGQDAAGAMTGTVFIESWDSPGQVATSIAAAYTTAAAKSAATGAIVFPQDTWVRVNSVSGFYATLGSFSPSVTLVVAVGTYTFTGAAGTLGTLAMTANSALNVLMPRAGPTEFPNSKLPWYSTRLTAVSALLTNTTKVLNKEGTVLWGRVSPSNINVWINNSTYVNTLHPAEKAFLPLESGTYTYAPPSTDMANFWDYTTNSALTASVPVVRLDNDSLVNVGYLTDPDGGSSLAMNIDWHLEFRTSSTLFQIGLSTAPIEALHSAQIALVKAGFFFDNFDHVSMIASIIRGLGSIYPLTKAIGPMFSGFAQSTRSANSIMSKSVKSVPSTTAARSGITGSRHSVAGSQALTATNLRRLGSVAPLRRGPRSVGSRRSGRSRNSRKSVSVRRRRR